MKTIEIATAHNIVVRQELASIMQRIAASALDAIIIATYASLMGLILNFGWISCMSLLFPQIYLK